jgi:hypothetical protein
MQVATSASKSRAAEFLTGKKRLHPLHPEVGSARLFTGQPPDHRPAAYWGELHVSQQLLGAGFLLTRRLVLTALYCLRGPTTSDIELDVLLEDESTLPGWVCAYDKSADLTLIMISSACKVRVPIPRPESPSAGTTDMVRIAPHGWRYSSLRFSQRNDLRGHRAVWRGRPRGFPSQLGVKPLVGQVSLTRSSAEPEAWSPMLPRSMSRAMSSSSSPAC